MSHQTRLTAAKVARRIALIEPLTVRRQQPLEPLRFQALDSPLEVPDLSPTLDTNTWPAIPSGTYWGDANLNFVLRGSFHVPPEWDREEPMALRLELGDSGDFSHPEALVYIDGRSWATIDRHHQEFRLAPEHCDGRPHNLVLHGWTGLLGGLDAQFGKKLRMQTCAVIQIDTPTRALAAAARTALQAANLLDENEPAKTRLYNALDAALQRLDTREPFGEAFYASVPDALAILRDGIAQAGPPLDVDLIAAGHAHIDVAWLWTLGQTRRKASRTFHTVLRLMDEFPDYHFTQSQPQIYSYLQQDHPDLFEAIQQRVAQGRWEPIGGMWIEADCNLSGAEALARQFLLGRSYFRQQFGPHAESPVLWLPDVFGYAWSLPQLIKLAGLEYFFTIKIGWNQYNKMPYDSFWWQGLDGTRVLTHFSTTPDAPWHGSDPDLMSTATYNANLSAFAVLGSWVKLQHKESQRVLLMSYGYGDGGGGPTREMNENAVELRQFPALPRVQQGKVIDFFRRLDAESGDRLPTWSGELYLELHRGTYTTQSRNKRANRRAEFLLHDVEFLLSSAALLDAASTRSQADLRPAWELLCLNQFHDIIPGSSIGAVYSESQAQYAEIQRIAEAVQAQAASALQSHYGGDLLLVNPTSFQRDDLAFWPGGALPEDQALYRDGQALPVQPVEGGLLIQAGALDSYSIHSLTLVAGHPPEVTNSLRVSPTLLENDCLRVELNAAGDIVRIHDKRADREVLPPGAVANQWQAFEDRPLQWDAWDIDIFYDDKQFLADPAESVHVVESGPLRATLEIRRRILNSTYRQCISLTAGQPQIDFETRIDWRERHILLKVAFPLDILASVATYEIQWGHVQRPTHRNTSWDWARFETVGHKWVALSEANYPVALLNDCKYGHDIRDNVIRLSLLRAPTSPDPKADQGLHEFRYSLLLPGEAPTNPVYEIARRAYSLNDALMLLPGRGTPPQPGQSLLGVDGSAIIETIKPAEDGRGLIVRLYESCRRRGWVTLRTGFPIASAHLTNLLEDDETPLEATGHSLRLYLKPFQIVTLRLCPPTD
jgi:alpha-mannosidase